MDFFKKLFYKDGNFSESVVLIDIGNESVAGAYALYKNGEVPQLLYTTQLPINPHKDEEKHSALIRTIKVLCDDLIKNGATTLVQTSGNGAIDHILISFDAPLQETLVHTELFEEKNPFVFTRDLVIERLKKTIVVPKEKILVDESIVGTILNGYTTHNPYGNKAHRASITVLTSLIEKQMMKDIITTIRSFYNSKNMLSISGNSLRYQVIRNVFPHEHNELIIDTTNNLVTSISIIRANILIRMNEIKIPSSNQSWLLDLSNNLSAVAKSYPLPKTVFLISNEGDADLIHKKLTDTKFTSLWLSENPPKIIPVLKSHLASSIKYKGTGSPNLPILFMTIYYKHYRLLNKDDKKIYL